MIFISLLHHKKKGFTLIEMIVSLALFTVVAVIAIGAFLKITDSNKKSQTLKTSINNLSFALESMSREMRVGSSYYCKPNPTPLSFSGNVVANVITNNSTLNISTCDDLMNNPNGWVIAFRSSKSGVGSSIPTCNLIYAYWYRQHSNDSTAFELRKAQQTTCDQNITQSSFSSLISPDVKFTGSRVDVNIAGTPTPTQPQASFWFKGYAGERLRERTEFEVQTSVSQRSTI